MTSAQITTLARLEKERTPGLWRRGTVWRDCIMAFDPRPDAMFGSATELVLARMNKDLPNTGADADYVVAACNTVPDLLVERAAIRQRITEVVADALGHTYECNRVGGNTVMRRCICERASRVTAEIARIMGDTDA